jgi:hypothetical protein
LDALHAKHAHLEAHITEESQRPLPDDTLLHELKKDKLRIKEEIEGISVSPTALAG